MTGTIQTFVPRRVSVSRMDKPEMRLEVIAKMTGGEWTWSQDGRSIHLVWRDMAEAGVLGYTVHVDGKATPTFVESGRTTDGSPTSWRAYYGAAVTNARCPVEAAATLLTSILPSKS